MKQENEEHPAKPDNGGNAGDSRPNHVTITINNKEYKVPPGNHPVVQLKNLGGVPKEEQLCLLVNGEIKPLTDKDHVDIQGGEIFASNTPSGGAS